MIEIIQSSRCVRVKLSSSEVLRAIQTLLKAEHDMILLGLNEVLSEGVPVNVLEIPCEVVIHKGEEFTRFGKTSTLCELPSKEIDLNGERNV